MGRPPKIRIVDGDNGEAQLRNTVDRGELPAYIKRIEQCNKEQKEISSDRQQIFKELRQAGYDRDTMRAIVRERKLTMEQREVAKALLDQYLSALGDFSSSPLGQAGADRMRSAPAP